MSRLLRLESVESMTHLDQFISDQNEIKDPKYIEAFHHYKEMKHQVKEERLNILNNHEEYFTGIAFISFEKMAHADLYTRQYSRSTIKWFLSSCKYKLRFPVSSDDFVRLRIDPAPEAEEVLWKNLRFSFKDQLKTKSKTALFVFLIMAITFGIIYALKSMPNTKSRYPTLDP